MDLFVIPEQQEVGETRFYDLDFNPKLRSGASVSGTPTVSHKKPDGTAGSAASVGAVSAGIVPVKFTSPSPVGMHTLVLSVVTTDAETLIAVLRIPVADF